MPKKQAAEPLQEGPVAAGDTNEDNADAATSAEQSGQTLDMPFDKLVRIYRRIGASIAEVQAQYDAQLESLKAEQDVFKAAIREHMKLQNATSINTPFGTAIMSVKTRYSTTDWDSFKTFVKENDALDLFEKRIAQANMAAFLKENPEKVPAGLNADASYDISVRKPKVSTPTK